MYVCSHHHTQTMWPVRKALAMYSSHRATGTLAWFQDPDSLLSSFLPKHCYECYNRQVNYRWEETNQTFSLQIISSVAGGRDAGVIDIASQTNECTPRVHSVWPRNRQKSKCYLPGSATFFAIRGSGEPAVIKANRENPYFQMKTKLDDIWEFCLN